MLLAVLFLGRKYARASRRWRRAPCCSATPFMPASFWARMATIFDEQQDKAHYTGSSEARRQVMQEGIDAFLTFPLTGVGAGQFKNLQPAGRKERWRETHNALIQVAAETGILGLAVFMFLIVRGGMAAARTRRLLSRPRKGSDPLALVMSDDESAIALRPHRRDDRRSGRLVHLRHVRVGRLQLDVLLPAGADRGHARAHARAPFGGPVNRGGAVRRFCSRGTMAMMDESASRGGARSKAAVLAERLVEPVRRRAPRVARCATGAAPAKPDPRHHLPSRRAAAVRAIHCLDDVAAALGGDASRAVRGRVAGELRRVPPGTWRSSRRTRASNSGSPRAMVRGRRTPFSERPASPNGSSPPPRRDG